LAGGMIVATNVSTTIGKSSRGEFTMIGGTFLASNVTVGADAGSQGTFRLAGGTNLIGRGDFRVGFNANSTGTVWVTGGLMVLTNINDILLIANIGNGQM